MIMTLLFIRASLSDLALTILLLFIIITFLTIGHAGRDRRVFFLVWYFRGCSHAIPIMASFLIGVLGSSFSLSEACVPLS